MQVAVIVGRVALVSPAAPVPHITAAASSSLWCCSAPQGTLWLLRRGNPYQRHFRTPNCTLALCGLWEYSFYAVALKQLQLVVRGRVQGVYFRASTQREARRLGLSGWVKNRPDGTVEVLVEGEETSIRELYSWAQKGPGAARVERVDARWRSFTGEFPDFRITE